MGLLNAAQRDALPDHAFALPGRRYPIHDINHAKAALSRVAANGTPHEEAVVRMRVASRYPNMHMDPK